MPNCNSTATFLGLDALYGYYFTETTFYQKARSIFFTNNFSGMAFCIAQPIGEHLGISMQSFAPSVIV